MSDTIVTIEPQIHTLTPASPIIQTILPGQYQTILVDDAAIQTVVTDNDVVNTVATSQQQIVLNDQTSVQILTAGTQGPAGQGLPTGGTTNQLLKKNSSTNFDYSWADVVTGVSSVFGRGGAITAQSGDYAIGQISGAGTLAAQNSANLSSQATGTLQAAQFPALTGDVTTSSGSLATSIASNAVSNAKFRQSAALAVVGNATNATANVADITAGSDNQVLRRSGTAVGFGAVNLASSSAVTSQLPIANGGHNASTAAAGMTNLISALTDASGIPLNATEKTSWHVFWNDSANTAYRIQGSVLSSTIVGLVPSQWLTKAAVTKTANYTIADTDGTILCNASGGAFTVTLPTSVGRGGKAWNIVKTDSSANAVTIATTSSQTINGVTTKTLTSQYQTMRPTSDNANWFLT